MIWLDFFLQAFIHALAWCLAIPVTAVLLVLAARAFSAWLDWLERPRALKPRRDPFSGGLS